MSYRSVWQSSEMRSATGPSAMCQRTGRLKQVWKPGRCPQAFIALWKCKARAFRARQPGEENSKHKLSDHGNLGRKGWIRPKHLDPSQAAAVIPAWPKFAKWPGFFTCSGEDDFFFFLTTVKKRFLILDQSTRLIPALSENPSGGWELPSSLSHQWKQELLETKFQANPFFFHINF